MKVVSGALLLLFSAGLFVLSCGTDATMSTETLTDQEGTLIWGGEPARDGSGMLFETADTVYGAPGSYGDYSEFFEEDEFLTAILADIKLTGEVTVRGWGATFPEIEFVEINNIDGEIKESEE